MHALTVSIAAFVVIIIGTWVGVYLRTVLPKHHLDQDTRDAVRIGIGLIATMAALVLGLLLATAKSHLSITTIGGDPRQRRQDHPARPHFARDSDAGDIRAQLRDIYEEHRPAPRLGSIRAT